MNSPDSFIGRIYQGFDFLYHLLLFNLLWLGFTLLGAGILGFGPSTVALYAVTRKWIQKESGTDKDIVLLYWQTFKKAFKAGNIIGWSGLIIAYMLLVNYRFTNFRGGWLLPFINISTVIMAIIFSLLLAYLIPLYVHYEMKWKDYLIKAFILAYIQPLPTVLLAGWIALVSFLTVSLFPFSMLLFMSGLAYGIMGICYSSFMRNEYLLKDKTNQQQQYHDVKKGEKK